MPPSRGLHGCHAWQTVRGRSEQLPPPELQDLETLAPLGDGWMGDASVVTALSLGRSVVLSSQRPW